jgi:hypothetical protein
MKRLLIAALALLSACAAPRYAEDLHTPNTPPHVEKHVSVAVERFSAAIGRDVPDDILAGWSLEYVGNGVSATYPQFKTIRIGKENRPELVLKHEITHVLLFYGGAPGPAHHHFMCRHDLCYGSVSCNLECETQ